MTIELLGAQQLGRVVAREVGASQVTVGDLAGQTLGQRKAYRLRHGGQEHPKVARLHQQDLTALGSRLDRLHDGVLVALGQDAVLAEFFAAGRGR
jgi:hypothetical protein